MSAFISICIPAYKRTGYLLRLLDSIAAQTYDNFEVVITDDTPGNDVKDVIENYKKISRIFYYKNEPALGTPENWNEGIRKAKGEWIKIMHDDDWFTANDSLQFFADSIKANPSSTFLFSAYNNVFEKDGSIETVRVSKSNLERLKKDPHYLLRSNYIGNPSCTIIKKDATVVFDKRLRFVVDFEFYIRYLGIDSHRFTYIKNTLINVGMNDSQVTTYTANVSQVQVPENHILLDIMGADKLRHIVVYDYYWRLYRNFKIRNAAAIQENGYAQPVDRVLKSMIRWQSVFPLWLLKIGFFSKCYMMLHYLTHFFYLPKKTG